MNERIHSTGPNRLAEVSEITWEDEQQQFEDSVEWRLKNLGDRMARWIDTSCFLLTNQADSIQPAFQQLAVQEAGLRWIVKIARRSEGAIRARLWLDIERALSDLEDLEAQIVGSYDDSLAAAFSTPAFGAGPTRSRNSSSTGRFCRQSPAEVIPISRRERK